MKLHIGCGVHRLPPPWVNIDAVESQATDDVIDLCGSALPPGWAGMFEQIYASHFVEHLPVDMLPLVLADWRRALAPGGRLTLATIDIQGIFLRAYGKGYSMASVNSYLYGGEGLMRHRQVFDAAYLEGLLRVAGFATVRPWALAEYPEICALNDCASTSHHVTLYLEGVK